MDELLPAEHANLHYIYNNKTCKYDVIDLNTGKMYEPAMVEADAYNYSLAMADVICALIRDGKPLTQICSMQDMPSVHRVYAWMALHPEFKIRYDQARKQRADAYHDRVMVIAEQAGTAHKDFVPGMKLAADLFKWGAEKGNPDIYGAKKDDSGPKGTNINITLHTGVLDSGLPTDIVVDEHGNFKGFGDVKEVEVDTGERGDEDGRGLSRDRFTVFEGEFTEVGGTEEGTQTESTEET